MAVTTLASSAVDAVILHDMHEDGYDHAMMSASLLEEIRKQCFVYKWRSSYNEVVQLYGHIVDVLRDFPMDLIKFHSPNKPGAKFVRLEP